MILKTLTAVFVFILCAFSFGQSAYEHTRAILSYGPRPSGSENLKKVQTYLISEIKKNKFQPELYQKKMKTPLGSIVIKNIAAVKKGKKNQYLVFSAHYESKYFQGQSFLGANDSASAVGILLELMEALKDKKLNIGVVFLFLDGEEAFVNWSEEDSLYGSRMQAAIWKDSGFLPLIHSFILLDIVGDEKTSFCKEENSDAKLTESIWNIAQKNNYSYYHNCKISISDDHIPFKNLGVRVLDLIAHPFPAYWHKDSDSFDKVSAKRLGEVKKVILDYFEELNEKIF